MNQQLEQPNKEPRPDIFDNIQSLALMTVLNEQQKNYLDQLVAQLNKILSERTVKQMVAEQDVAGLEKYLVTITKINKLLKNKEMPEVSYEKEKADWQQFYQEVFDTDTDFADLDLPPKPEGFNWLIIMQSGLTLNKVAEMCENKFKNWHYFEDLKTIKSVRSANKTYAVWVRDRIDADEENKYKTPNDCETEGIKGITLEERLLLELFYHWQTGKHLDIEYATLCSGSRSSEGEVPFVSMNGPEEFLQYFSPDEFTRSLRVRAVSG